MHVSRNDRDRWNSAVTDAARANLKTAVAAWYGASGLSRNAFRAQFLDPYTSDETVDQLRSAAKGIVEGRTYDDLAKAGKNLASAAQNVGSYKWPRFISDASQQAVAAVSQGDVPGVVKASAIDAPATGFFLVFLGLLALIFGWPGLKTSKTTPTPARPPSPTIMQQEGPQEEQSSGRPPDLAKPGEAILPDDRRKYILDGNGRGGGGHGSGRGTPEKSEFPPDWSDDKTAEAIESVANDPASVREPTKGDRTSVRGVRDGVEIEVIIGRDGKTIVTAYPTNVTPDSK